MSKSNFETWQRIFFTFCLKFQQIGAGMPLLGCHTRQEGAEGIDERQEGARLVNRLRGREDDVIGPQLKLRRHAHPRRVIGVQVIGPYWRAAAQEVNLALARGGGGEHAALREKRVRQVHALRADGHDQRLGTAAEGIGDRQPPDHLRERIKTTLDPLPIWYPPMEDGHVDPEEYPVHALTQRPMAMYHSWGTQNAWLRQLHGRNPLYLPTKLMRANNLQDGDWARVSSAHGSITVPVMEMAALNENTVWTWNAIGKRKGAWALDKDAPEATKGFLLNHLIHELLPPKGDGLRWANSDPVTGQAAWFDLRVKIEKSAAPEESQPAMPALKSPVPEAPKSLRWKVGKS